MTETLKAGGTGNRLLDRVPGKEAEELLPSLERVTLEQGSEVFRELDELSHVYFPVSGLCSLVVRLHRGEAVEAAAVGREGMIGLSAALDVNVSPCTATAQMPGESLRMPVEAFTDATGDCGEFDRLMRRYAAFRLRSAHQTVACNLAHTLEQRMCRWLLTAQDRARSDTFPLTHEFLSEMLGARRPTVTVIAGTLQAAGLIAYRRGVMRVIDRERLAAASCECYGVIRDLYDRIVR